MKAAIVPKKIRVIIADDHALFRKGVKTALFVKKDIDVVAEAENGLHLLDVLKQKKADVVLLDVQMPLMDGIHTLHELHKNHPHIKVIVLSMYNDHTLIANLMEKGANSYLTKNSDPDMIYQAIKTCYEQEYFFNDLTNKALLSGIRTKNNEQTRHDDNPLTDKEIRVLKLMCEEKTTKEIADIVEISPRTVEAIRDKLKLKTGAKSMAGLIIYAVKHGIFQEE